jgi:plasmid segregation protein ParM
VCKVIISIDSGKFLTKAVGMNEQDSLLEGKRVSFRSKLYNLNDGDVELAGNSFSVEYDDSKFIIGEQGNVDGVDDTNKATLLHKLCIYTAITRYIQPKEKVEIYMVIACPLNLLKSVEYKEEYKNFIMNNHNEINIKVNNEEFLFSIEDMTIKSEGSGVLYLDKERFNNCEVGLIDIGGLNMQFCKYVNGATVPESRFTEMTGSNKLVQDIKEDLEILLKGKPVAFEQSEQALKNKVLRINNSDMEESREIIRNRIHKYIVNDVIRKITKRRISLDLLQPIVVGGTCLNIKEELKNEIENVEIQEDPQWASVEGLFKIAFAKYM